MGERQKRWIFGPAVGRWDSPILMNRRKHRRKFEKLASQRFRYSKGRRRAAVQVDDN